MRVFYKSGFYLEGINTNIPKDSIEISEEYYRKLIEETNHGKKIGEDESGYPILIKDNTSEIYEELILIENDFEKAINQTVEFNGSYYKVKDVKDYLGLLQRYFEEGQTLNIWSFDNTDVKAFNKSDLTGLIKLLLPIYEQAYQEKKARKSALNNLMEN